MSELTQKLTKKEAMRAIAVLIARNYGNLSNQSSPVLALIDATCKTTQPHVASYAVSLWLDQFERLYAKAPFGNLAAISSLVSALQVSEHFTLEYGVAERLVMSTAQAGVHQKFPKLPIRLLGRSPTESEVTALVTAYVENTGSQCDQDEDHLRNLIQAFVPPQKRDEQRLRIDAFIQEWNKSDCY